MSKNKREVDGANPSNKKSRTNKLPIPNHSLMDDMVVDGNEELESSNEKVVKRKANPSKQLKSPNKKSRANEFLIPSNSSISGGLNDHMVMAATIQNKKITATEHFRESTIQVSKKADLQQPRKTNNTSTPKYSLTTESLDNRTTLISAARDGRLETVRFLLEKRPDVNLSDENGDTALHFAAYYGHLEVAKLLLRNGAIINRRDNNGYTALHLTLLNKHYDLAESLIAEGADVSQCEAEDILKIFNSAAKKEDFFVIQLLLFGVNQEIINKKDNDGFTTLQVAAQNGCLDVVKLLIANGAIIDQQDNNGSTPLHFAACDGHLEVVKFLIEKGADVNLLDQNGNSPLHFAACDGHRDIIRLLLRNGAKINQKDKNGNSPLHVAVQNGNIDVVKELVGFGANIYATSPTGKTLFDIAKDEGHVKILEYLQKSIKDWKSFTKPIFTPKESGQLAEEKLIHIPDTNIANHHPLENSKFVKPTKSRVQIFEKDDLQQPPDRKLTPKEAEQLAEEKKEKEQGNSR